tara:strand:- start:142 stop:522 length:381 start_codon:yes stop_codon:yes gene_type:complete
MSSSNSPLSTEDLLAKIQRLEKENQELREFRDEAEEECSASAVMHDFMTRIQRAEAKNEEKDEEIKKQMVVCVGETIEKERVKHLLGKYREFMNKVMEIVEDEEQEYPSWRSMIAYWWFPDCDDDE